MLKKGKGEHLPPRVARPRFSAVLPADLSADLSADLIGIDWSDLDSPALVCSSSEEGLDGLSCCFGSWNPLMILAFFLSLSHTESYHFIASHPVLEGQKIEDSSQIIFHLF